RSTDSARTSRQSFRSSRFRQQLHSCYFPERTTDRNPLVALGHTQTDSIHLSRACKNTPWVNPAPEPWKPERFPLARNQAGRTTESTAATTLATGIPVVS